MNIVVIIGRTNVGKSTLFNRLSPFTKSITLNYEGVTRDFLKEQVCWQDQSFILIDTGGISLRKSKNLDMISQKIQAQVLDLVQKAKCIVFMVDGNVGLLPEDREIASYLHKLNKPVIIAVNKIDNQKMEQNAFEFQRTGFDNIVTISAEHGLGINNLLDAITDCLPKSSSNNNSECKLELDQLASKAAYKVVFLGRPNVGKSSLMNNLLKEERSLVSNQPGTTREAISEDVLFYKEAIQLTDTPGIRRKRKVESDLEQMMVKSSFHALKDTDIVVLMIDGSERELLDQDLKLAFYAFTQEYKALIILVNKSDLMTEESKEFLDRSLDYYKYLLHKIPMLFISCKTGKNLGKILPLIQKTWTRYNQEFSKTELNELFITQLNRKPLYRSGNKLHLFNVKQLKSAPIILLLEVNEPSWFGESQKAFFDNILRTKYNLTGVPVKFIIKKYR